MQVAAFGREQLRDAEADAARATGKQRNAPFEIEFHVDSIRSNGKKRCYYRQDRRS